MTFLIVGDRIVNLQAQPQWRVYQSTLQLLDADGMVVDYAELGPEVTVNEVAQALHSLAGKNGVYTVEDLEAEVRVAQARAARMAQLRQQLTSS